MNVKINKDTLNNESTVKSLIKVITGIKQGTTKSYSILTDHETLVLSDVLTTAIVSLQSLLKHPTVANDATLLEFYNSRIQEYVKIADELQYQLLQNARPKPLVTES